MAFEKPPAAVIRQLLLDLALVYSTPTGSQYAARVSSQPESPDRVVTVYDTGATEDGRLLDTGEVIEHPTVKVRVRGPVYEEAWNKAKEIELALNGVKRTTVAVGGVTFRVDNVSSRAPLVLGPDDEERRQLTVDCNCTITQTSS